jgi:steroid delta-isomerase-like uncharacterized protein
MRRSMVAGALVALAACAPRSGPSPTVARNEIVARTLMEAWESGDRDLITDLFAPDAVYDDYPNQMQYQGIPEIVGYVRNLQEWADGLNIDVGAVHPSEEGATVEWVLSAVQARPIGTRVPLATGREVVLNGATILEIRSGRIRHAADYMDALALALQLGGELHMPGGGVIRLDDVLPPVDTTRSPR